MTLFVMAAWLLMQAPQTNDAMGQPVDHSRATIRWWNQVHAYDTARDCEESRTKDSGVREVVTRCIPAYVIYP